MARDLPDIVSLEDAASEPYATILAYPRPDEFILSSRIQQLRDLGITELEFAGNLSIGKLSVLGKGVAGVVVLGRAGKTRTALKIRRIDSRRDSVRHEGIMLKAANDINVGPRYYGNTDDILAMEFIEGQNLPDWITSLKGRGRKSRFRMTARELFEQCFRMDKAGLNHGELSRAHKNVSVTADRHPVVLDFESASKKSSPNNLTSITQYFFLGQGFAKKIRRITGPTDNEALKKALRKYKSERTINSFRGVEELLQLVDSVPSVSAET